jgi:glycosyltransferase involved in cell wall biosynthesis
VRILLVSQMYPGPDDPDLGTFVADLERALAERGHELERAVVDRRGARWRHARLLRETRLAARRFRPDVVYAHFLVPAGLWAALAGGAPLVVTAHGQDVENARASRPVRAATRLVVRRARAVVAVSDWLRRRLVEAAPEADGKTEVIDCGVDLERFQGRDAQELRTKLGWEGGPPFYVLVGSLVERKNPLRLAEAFERLNRGSLAIVGDGPLRGELEGRPRVRLVGRVSHEEAADWIAASDVVCQPSLSEPFGQALLEGLASERSVVATRVGGPPEFVPPEAGVLVDPTSVDGIEEALRKAAALPSPNPAARAAAAEHDVRRQAERVERVLQAAAAQ